MSRNWNEELPNRYDREILKQDCTKFFREHTIFDKILKGFREKYQSYGSFSGTIKLSGLSEEDREALEGFFCRSYHGRKSVSISAEKFEKALKNSKFELFSGKEVLELYFKEAMTGKREKLEEEREKWTQMLSNMKKQCMGTSAEAWFEMLEMGTCSSGIYLKRCYKEANFDIEEVKRFLRLGIEIINQFPYRRNTSEYLAVFAAVITGNPHAFDENTKEGQFLDILINENLERRKKLDGGSKQYFAFEKQRKSLEVGILRDDISNYVMLSGIRARKKSGEFHSGMEGFFGEGEPISVPLSVLMEWEAVECPENEIYILENPSVFAVLCKKWRGKKACMCMNGQPRLSSVLMLDLLAKSDVKIYYAGDFDPEGILIAWKIKQYYKGTVQYWHMSVNEYVKSCSKETISEKRMKMLEKITDPELSDLLLEFHKKKLAGYQENIIDLYSLAHF